MNNSCALILRGFPHCQELVDTRKNVLTYTLDDYKDNFQTRLFEPLKKQYDVVDVYVYTNASLTEEEMAFFKPVFVHTYDGLDSTQLQKLHDMCVGVPKVYSYYVIHRFDVLYKNELSFSEPKTVVVAPCRHNRYPHNPRWGYIHPQWIDVYFEIPHCRIYEFIDILEEHARRKPLYHLMLHGIYAIYLERNIPVHFLCEGMHGIIPNPFFAFVSRN